MSENFLLKVNSGATHRRKRLGAGPGSGRGATCCRGRDGQRSRSGKKRPYVAFEGGQMPLYKRVPKRGFFHKKADFILFNLQDLNLLENGTVLDLKYLIENKIVKNPQVKIYVLAKGSMDKSITVHVNRISSKAKDAIEKAGGKVVVIKETEQ
jgi:large subunit ribosomal protein L15